MRQHKFFFRPASVMLSLLMISCGSQTPTPVRVSNTPARVPPARSSPTAAATLVPSRTSTAIPTPTTPTQTPASPTRSIAATPSAELSAAINYYNLGLKSVGRADYDNAIAMYTQAIQAQPDYLNAYLQRGFVYCLRHDTDRAMEDWKTVRGITAINLGDVKTQNLANYFLIAFAKGC